MKIVRTFLLGTVVGVLVGGSAIAAEILGEQPEAYSSDFDWNGVYVGVGASADAYTDGFVSGNSVYLDVIVGANVTTGDFLLGAEAWVGWYNDIGFSTGFGAGAEVRAGALVSEGVLIYAGLGGYVFDAGNQYGTLGLGAEFVVGDNMTLDLEYKYWQGLNNAFTASSLGASLNWYF